MERAMARAAVSSEDSTWGECWVAGGWGQGVDGGGECRVADMLWLLGRGPG